MAADRLAGKRISSCRVGAGGQVERAVVVLYAEERYHDTGKPRLIAVADAIAILVEKHDSIDAAQIARGEGNLLPRGRRQADHERHRLEEDAAAKKHN